MLNNKGIVMVATVMLWYTGALLTAVLVHGAAEGSLKAPNFKANPFTVDTVDNPAMPGWERDALGNHGNF